ncbi:MAG: DUF6485 family protein [Candidatus Omnitrophota bacterium]
MKNCQNQSQNLENCNCSYDPCPRKGICCECIAYHRRRHELPACFFSSSAEKSYDRSVKKFMKDSQR